jgi:hypothetical protein
MFFACYNDDMNNGQPNTITAIITVVVFIIGAILLLVGDKAGDKKKKQMLSIVGTAFIASAGISIFINSAELREILVAFAAVFAAIIAALSIYQSRQIRQDSIERESRDRRERLANEVTEWLRGLENRIFPQHGAIRPGLEDMKQRNPEISRETWLQLDDLDNAFTQINALSKGIKEAEYYQKLSSKLKEELSISIGVIMDNLKQRMQLVAENANSPCDYGEIIRKIQEGTLGEEMEKEFALITELIENYGRPLEGLNLSNRDVITIRLGRNSGATRESIHDALDRAIEFKVSIVQASDFVSPWRL